MSWEAGIMLLLAAALIGGMVWYERARPPAQVVALVAALAALATVGRIAFSPIPNVVPTTDIALISGYAVGGAPGFAVGAFAALASNFWLGQGPWTPWQMAGWGLTGLLGAALAFATGRRLGRVGLAVACGLAGLAYGALLDLSLMVTYGGEQSLDRFFALSARGLPFNIAHATGNAALALVAGPALVRMLGRYRRRFEYAWESQRGGRGREATGGIVTGTACVLAAVVVAGGVLGGAASAPAAQRGPGGEDVQNTKASAAARGPAAAVAYLRRAQNKDGGFGASPGDPSSPAMTGWAALGLEAAEVNPLAVRRGGPSAIAYLRGAAGEISTTGDLERTILVLSAAGLNPRSFGGRDLVARLLARRGKDGSWGGQVNPTAFGILALDAAGRRSGNARSAAWLAGVRGADGGWGFAPGAATSDADSTGAALQALAAAGRNRSAIDSGVSFLRGSQREDGGFVLLGGPVNAQSTAWAAQGLVAAGVSPARVRSGGRSPLDYLASVQAGDGHYRYSRSTDQTPVWVTSQALQAASGRAFPLPRVAKPSKATGGGQAAAGGGGAAGVAGTGGTGGAAPAAKGTGKPGAGAGAPAVPAAPVVPAAPAPVPTDLERVESGSEDGGDEDGGADLAMIGSITLVIAVAVGGGWLLRRQRVS